MYDTRTGCWHHLHKGLQVTTASVIKAQVLGAVLLKAQDAGRGLTAWERSQIRPMIRYSFNPETSNLYAHLGYEERHVRQRPALRRHVHDPHRHVRAHAAAPPSTAPTWRCGSSTAAAGCARPGREEAWAYMTDVHPLQEWGISAGVPAGWTVAQKNGFYPSTGIGWRVGSSGFVRQDGADQGYAITVMTEGAIEPAHRDPPGRGGRPPGGGGPHGRPRPSTDRSTAPGACSRASGESWTAWSRRGSGLPSSRAGEVRTTSGGNASPLSGQQACSPDIPPRAASRPTRR